MSKRQHYPPILGGDQGSPAELAALRTRLSDTVTAVALLGRHGHAAEHYRRVITALASAVYIMPVPCSGCGAVQFILTEVGGADVPSACICELCDRAATETIEKNR